MRAVNSVRVALMVAFALLVPQAATHAQGMDTAVIANIPFAFQIGAYHYRPGEYTVHLQGSHVLSLSSSKDSGLMEVSWDTALRPSTTGALVFHRYGNQYFLRQMRVRGSSESLISPQSKEERSAQKEVVEAKRNADLGHEPDVQVALIEGSK
jgi:hypothetical protein